MLAYVFWHWPLHAVEASEYEVNLTAFHRSLAANRPPGLIRSAVFRSSGAPWTSAATRAYEDWYLLEHSAAIDSLNEAAVSGARKVHHDAAARDVAGAAGGLYQLRTGDPEVSAARFAWWLTKPRGTGYEDFYARLEPWTAQPGTSLWRRQMVLGPSPEFCLLTPHIWHLPADFASVSITLESLWPPPKG